MGRIVNKQLVSATNSRCLGSKPHDYVTANSLQGFPASTSIQAVWQHCVINHTLLLLRQTRRKPDGKQAPTSPGEGRRIVMPSIMPRHRTKVASLPQPLSWPLGAGARGFPAVTTRARFKFVRFRLAIVRTFTGQHEVLAYLAPDGRHMRANEGGRFGFK